jgi:hypothetical protein
MAITDYASLKTETATWLARADQTSNLDTFIDNTEAWLNRNLRVRQMEAASTTLTISATGVVSHPSDWAAWKNIKITSAPIKHIDVNSEETADLRFEAGQTGRPLRAVVRGDSTYLFPVPDSTTYTYEFVYFAKIPALSSAGGFTTNWLLLAHSDIYLYGCMWQASMLLRDAEAASYWKGLFDQMVDELRVSAGNDLRSGGSRVPRVRNVV